MASIKNFNINEGAKYAMILAARSSLREMKTLRRYKLNRDLCRLGLGTNEVESGIGKNLKILKESERRCCIKKDNESKNEREPIRIQKAQR